ncbi:Uncharacterised protein [Mycobacteroides abscessus subsp. abscessus]|nr:Uncharacterised protein [Mycobacteroides abscessus subsp. abscessus]SHZ17643.1 Uncharacterised protein [Mycobacteroides abscessus subsp. abscessus]SIB51395.1 Uncharacterised protein [Mycobacteroides abscessus subsp. abscessus]SIF17936.1 Uncharacterised protein [Mycobacteroides abscessus subsp. abscessus]SKI48002.1 Uncharacterised protein [Mycobacteroides abscessus subsp. abscessus]
MFAFGNAAVGYSTLATEVDGVSQELTTALHSLADQEGGDISAHKAFIAHVIAGSNELAASMMDTSSACAAQDAADAALAQAPTPEAVERARARAKVLMQLAAAGKINPDAAWDAQDDAERLEAERKAAVEAHEAETSGTTFEVPESEQWSPWSPHGDAEGGDEKKETGEDDNTDGEWGGGEDEPEDESADQPGAHPPGDQRQMPVTPQPTAEPRVSAPTAVSPETEAAFNAWINDSPAPASTTLSSADGPAPATTTTPTYSTTLPQPTPVANQATVASPAFMQPSQPPPTGPSSANQLRPYGPANPANHPSQQTQRTEDRQMPLDTGAAAVMATQSHVVSPAPTMPVSSPAPSAAPTTPTVPPLGQVPPGQPPTATGQPPVGASPVGAGVPTAAANSANSGAKSEQRRVVDLPDALRKLMTDEDVKRFYEETGTRPPDAPADPVPNPNPHVGAKR